MEKALRERRWRAAGHIQRFWQGYKVRKVKLIITIDDHLLHPSFRDSKRRRRRKARAARKVAKERNKRTRRFGFFRQMTSSFVRIKSTHSITSQIEQQARQRMNESIQTSVSTASVSVVGVVSDRGDSCAVEGECRGCWDRILVRAIEEPES